MRSKFVKKPHIFFCKDWISLLKIKCSLTEHTCWSKAKNDTSDQNPVKSSSADEEKDPNADSKDMGTDGGLKVSTKAADSILTAIDEILGESQVNLLQDTNVSLSRPHLV